MRIRPTSRVRLAAVLATSAALTSGCGALTGQGLDEPKELTVHLTVPRADAASSFEGRPYGCDDLLVPVTTAPSSGVDHGDAALDFLFSDLQGEHGDPALQNAVKATADTLHPTGHHRDGSTEVFTFDGTVTAEDECAAQRIRAQLQETARAQSPVPDVRLEVGGRPLDEVLGLPALSLGDPVKGRAASTPRATPTPESTPFPTATPTPTPTTAPEGSASPTPTSASPTATPAPSTSAAPSTTGPSSASPASPYPASADPATAAPTSASATAGGASPSVEPTDGTWLRSPGAGDATATTAPLDGLDGGAVGGTGTGGADATAPDGAPSAGAGAGSSATG
ncbi:hypothetical protein [Micrococcus porci]|uniref:hypothetical protein n=1 Tax=Micrococcus porci TaxID=2856555 RepID=UPI003CEA8303